MSNKDQAANKTVPTQNQSFNTNLLQD